MQKYDTYLEEACFNITQTESVEYEANNIYNDNRSKFLRGRKVQFRDFNLGRHKSGHMKQEHGYDELNEKEKKRKIR